MEKPMPEVKYDRRTGNDRRNFSPHIHITERRSGKDQRKSIALKNRLNHISKFEENTQHISDCLKNS
jgi:hypothetical protein